MLIRGVLRLSRTDWFPAAVTAPIVALLTRALDDQHSDNLLLAVYSVDHPFDRYLPRFLPLIQFAASPINDYSANLRFQVFLRVFSFCFVIVWVARRAARSISGSAASALAGAIAISFYFLVRYPEANDSVVYGASAGLQATVVFIAAVGVVRAAQRTTLTFHQVLLVVLAIGIASLSLLYYFMLILWAPVIVVLDSLSRKSHDVRLTRLLTRDLLVRKLSPLWVLSVGAFVAFAYLKLGTTEQTGITLSRSLSAVRSTRYLWDQGNFYIRENLAMTLILGCVLIIAVRSFAAVALAVIGVTAASGVFVVAAIDHVAENVHLPRYYAPSLFVGLVILVSAIASMVPQLVTCTFRFSRLSALVRKSNRWLPHAMVAAGLIVAAIGSNVFAKQPIGFGFEGADGQQIRKQGFPLSLDDLMSASDATGKRIDFVQGSHWNVWTTVFLAGENGVRVFPFGPFTRALDRSSEYVPYPPVYGLCIDMSAYNCGEVVQLVLSDQSEWELLVLEEVVVGSGRTLHLVKLDKKGAKV